MDDLFLALYRRRVEEGLEHQKQALESDQPLWALWEYSREPHGTALTMEFVALANHRKAIRAEIAASAERFRAEQQKGLESVLQRYGVDAEQCPSIVCAVLLTSVSRVLVIEQESLDMSSGHAQTIAFVERFLTQLEGPRHPRAQH
jgi:hypothetical protein